MSDSAKHHEGAPGPVATWVHRLGGIINRTFGRGPSLFRRLGISMDKTDLSRRGLIIIQIDGLSYNRMLKSLRKRRMPFVRKLIKRGRLKVHPYLSQLPTSTPAFQAGMFYGNNDNIPGFQFYDKQEKRFYKMGDSGCAYAVQSTFKNPGLLRGGSVFSCVYSGEAEASLFIFSSLLAPRRWKFALRLWDLALLTFLHITLVLKIIFLALLELITGLYDFVRRAIRNGRVYKEPEAVAIRIGLSVVSRELITLGAVIDIYRRVPIIYINYLSYDEHSHMRGPNSAFASWSLRSIDRCIKKIYTANIYAERKYDVYILSDHGQSACRPFMEVAGETLAEYLQSELVELSVEHYGGIDEKPAQLREAADATNRIAQSSPWFLQKPLRRYSDHMRRLLPHSPDGSEMEASLDVTVVSTGPIGYAYWTKLQKKLTLEDIEAMHPGLIDRVVQHPCISFVLVAMDSGDVHVRCRSGRAILRHRGSTFEGSFPFDRSVNRQHVLEGIRRITLFQRSGDICFWGGGSPKGDISFTDEFGAHSGWTDEEIQAFVMSPPHINHNFASIRRHAEFYEFFSTHYCWHGEDQKRGQEPPEQVLAKAG